METDNQYSPFNHQELFRKWAQMWHGDHDANHEDHPNCEIYIVLQNKEAPFEWLYNAVIENDDCWEDSWGMYVSNSRNFIKQI